MNYDDLIDETGGMGRFQIMVSVLIGFYQLWLYPAVATPFIVMLVDHWCEVPELRNMSAEQQRYIAIPYTEDGEYDKCNR